MKALADALPWVAFWLFAAVVVWCEHRIAIAKLKSKA